LATTHFRHQGKLEETQFRARFPTQPTESLAYGFFAETKPSRNPSVAVFFGLEAKDSAIALGDSLRHRSSGRRSSLGSRQGAQSPSSQALLVATKSACGVAEAASNIVLIRVSGFEKLHHSVGFRSGIGDRIVGEADAVDQNHSLLTLGLEGNVMVHHGVTRQWKWSRQELGLLGR